VAEIYLDSTEIDAAAGELRRAKEIINLQCNTLNEVIQIIEQNWQCTETARLCQCIEHTRKRLQSTGDAFYSIADDLEEALEEAKRADTLRRQAFGAGGGGGGVR